MNQPLNSTVWKVHFSVCLTFFLMIKKKKFTPIVQWKKYISLCALLLMIFFFFTSTYKWPVYRESQGRKLAVQNESKMFDIAVTVKYGHGQWKWSEQVKLNE